MSEYLILAEYIVYKNDKLSFIGTIEDFKTVVMPAEFNFDMVILCGPKWSVGKHKLSVKLMADNGKESELGNTVIEIPHEDFVYNAFLNDIKIQLDYSVSRLTFNVYDGDKEIITKDYPVYSMLVPREQSNATLTDTDKKIKNNDSVEVSEKFGTFDRPIFSAFYNLETKQDIDEAFKFLEKISVNNSMKSILRKRIEKQLIKIKETN